MHHQRTFVVLGTLSLPLPPCLVRALWLEGHMPWSIVPGLWLKRPKTTDYRIKFETNLLQTHSSWAYCHLQTEQALRDIKPSADLERVAALRLGCSRLHWCCSEIEGAVARSPPDAWSSEQYGFVCLQTDFRLRACMTLRCMSFKLISIYLRYFGNKIDDLDWCIQAAILQCIPQSLPMQKAFPVSIIITSASITGWNLTSTHASGNLMETVHYL